MSPLFESKTEKFKRTNKYVGAHLPIDKVHHLTLFCLVSEKTKNDVIRALLLEHLEIIPDEKKLIKDLVVKIKKDWEKIHKDNKGKRNWSNEREIGLRKRQYKDKIVKNLVKSRLTETHVHDIMYLIESELV